MKKHLFLLLWLPMSLLAQDRPELAVSLIPADIRADANAVIRSQQVEFEVKSVGVATYWQRLTVTLFNDRSQFDMMVVHYSDFNKLGKIRGKLYDAQGKLVREAKKNEIRDQSAISDFSIYEDDRVRYLDIDCTDYPYTVEYEYEMTFKDTRYYPDWYVREFAVGVEKAELIIKVPTDLALSYRVLNMDAEPTVTESNGMKRYHWTATNLPPVKKEPKAPPTFELLPAVLVTPTAFETSGYQGSLATWNDFGQFMNKLMEGRDKLSPEMQATVHGLTASAASDREKIDVLYRYLQQNMRYVSVQLGIGGWQPFSAEYVEKNKYGDCKALSNFMMAMLKEVGIGSYPVLIYAGDLHYDVKEDFTYDNFNHVILHVPSENYWLECTSAYAPPNYLGSGTDDRNVLLITDKGGQLARTPPLLPEQNLEANELTIVLENTGSARLELVSERSGERQEFYRAAAKLLSPEDLKKRFQAEVPLPSFTLQNLEVLPDPHLPKATLRCQAEVPRFASKAGKRLFVPLNPMSAFTDIPPAVEQRQHPIVQQLGHVETDRIILQVPEGYYVESMPYEPIVIESSHAKYSLQVTQDEGSVTVERRLEVLPCRLPADQYEAWRDIYKQIAKADGTKLVLVSRT